jgi:rhodanese-related sulfurtransferase
MPRKTFIFLVTGASLALWFFGSVVALGVTVPDLQKRLSAGEKLTVIDLRSTAQFLQAHIPGAINIPETLCAQKNLPPLGNVVVYDAGLGFTQPDNAAAALGAKKGISVEILDGGFAAWENSQGTTTRGRGMKSERLNYISYADLKAAKPGEILLLDLRVSTKGIAKTGNASAEAAQPLTDLTKEFPGMRQSRTAVEPQSLKASGTPPLLVLIDAGDGKAQKMAQSLKAQGIKRYVILAGGEKILARHGQRGLERSSSGNRIIRPASTNGGAAK